MSFFDDLLANESIRAVYGEGTEAIFEFFLTKLEELANNTETDADNIALESFLRGAADRLAVNRDNGPE